MPLFPAQDPHLQPQHARRPTTTEEEEALQLLGLRDHQQQQQPGEQQQQQAHQQQQQQDQDGKGSAAQAFTAHTGKSVASSLGTKQGSAAGSRQRQTGLNMSESADSGEEMDAINDEHIDNNINSSEESSGEQELNQSFELREQERSRHMQEMSTIEHEYAQLKRRLFVIRREKIEQQLEELQQGELLELKEAVLEYETEYKKQVEVATIRRQYRLAGVESFLLSELQRAESDFKNNSELAKETRIDKLRIRKMQLKKEKELMDMPAPSPERTARPKQSRNRGTPIWDGSMQAKTPYMAPAPAPANFRRPSLSTGLMSPSSAAASAMAGGAGMGMNPMVGYPVVPAAHAAMYGQHHAQHGQQYGHTQERRGSAAAAAAGASGLLEGKKKPRTSIWTGPYVVYMLAEHDIDDDLREMMGMGGQHLYQPHDNGGPLRRKVR